MGELECNGVAERFIRTLEEECLYLHDFESLAEGRREVGVFIERYNQGWLLERQEYRTPPRSATNCPSGRPHLAAHLSRKSGPLHCPELSTTP